MGGPELVLAQRLGEGGGATVYAARWRGREVSAKVAHDAEAAAELAAEAEVLARVAHPALLEVLGEGTLADGRAYLLLPRLRGEDLAARLVRGPLAVEAALGVVAAIAGALTVLHDAGVVHRDLKPENVYLADVGVFLLDLGLARPLAAGAAPRIRGTYDVMAPERLYGEPACVATEVYELAALAWTALAGDLPWAAGAAPSARRWTEPLPVAGPRGAALDEVLRGALSTVPERRPASVAALSDALHTAALRTAVLSARRTADVPPRFAGAVAPRSTGEVAPRFAGEVAPRSTGAVAPRFAGEVAPRFAGEVAPRLAGEVAPRLAGEVAPRLAGEVAPRSAVMPRGNAPTLARRPLALAVVLAALAVPLFVAAARSAPVDRAAPAQAPRIDRAGEVDRAPMGGGGPAGRGGPMGRGAPAIATQAGPERGPAGEALDPVQREDGAMPGGDRPAPASAAREIRVVRRPASARVEIDGELVGARVMLAPGRHRLRATAADHVAQDRVIDARTVGDALDVQLARRAPRPAPALRSLLEK